MSRLTFELRWLIGVRLVAVTSAVVPSAFLRLAGRPAYGDPALYWITVLTWLESAVYLALHGRLRPRAETTVQLGGDLLLVTALVFAFGGAASPFSILYLLVIAAAAWLLGRAAAMRFATAAWALYCATALALHLGWTPPGTSTLDEALAPWRVAYNLAIHGFGFYVLAHLVSHLTEERRLRADLADLETVHRDIIESIPSGLMTTDREGRITRINRAGREILGRPARELVGYPIHELGLLSTERWRALAAAPPAERPAREEVEWRRGEEPLAVGFSVSVLRHADGTPIGFVVIFQDLTAWRRLQDELQLKDRMAAVGQLAAGIAHEIGNPLAAISGSVQLLSGSPRVNTAEQKLLEIILKESQRLDRTIKGFLRFARPRERSGRQFDIAALIRENVELLRNSPEVSPGHHIEVRLAPPAVEARGDPDQISQILWNLSRNALRAMPRGGTLWVTGEGDGEVFRLRVRDTGRGMGAEERARLFQPFHSFFDQGTGIGMAIVYRIVQEHGGRLAVDSRPGEGTTITCELPLAGRAGGAAPPAGAMEA